MIILLSPTKTFTKSTNQGNIDPLFVNKTNQLVNIIKKYSIDDIKKTFKQSDNITNNIYNYYSNFNNEYAAVYLYGGTSFKYLDPLSIYKENLNNLYIFSALYGLNNALNNIGHYRLDMKDKINGINLYQYWKNDLNEFIENKFNNKIIINLASAEYYKIIDINKENIYTIDFKISDKKISSMELKKLRGLFAREILINNYKNIKEIKEISILDYKINNELSSNNKLIFERKTL